MRERGAGRKLDKDAQVSGVKRLQMGVACTPVAQGDQTSPRLLVLKTGLGLETGLGLKTGLKTTFLWFCLDSLWSWSCLGLGSLGLVSFYDSEPKMSPDFVSEIRSLYRSNKFETKYEMER